MTCGARLPAEVAFSACYLKPVPERPRIPESGSSSKLMVFKTRLSQGSVTVAWRGRRQRDARACRAVQVAERVTRAAWWRDGKNIAVGPGSMAVRAA